MKTFTKTLLAAALGALGPFDAAQASLPYDYSSSSYGAGYGIAAGGCYVPKTPDRCDTGYDTSYRPTGYGRSAYRYSDYGYTTPSRSAYDDRFRTPSYPAGGTSYGGWDDDCGTTGRPPSKASSYRDRYDGSPSFEPWRPASASHHLGRRNW